MCFLEVVDYKQLLPCYRFSGPIYQPLRFWLFLLTSVRRRLFFYMEIDASAGKGFQAPVDFLTSFNFWNSGLAL